MRTSRHPYIPGVSRRFTNGPAVSLALLVEGVNLDAVPMVALVFAPEHAGPADAENIPWAKAARQDTVHIHRVVVHVLAVTEVFPVFATVLGANDSTHFDGAE